KEETPDWDGLDNLMTSEIENRQPRRLEEKEVEVVGVYEHQEPGLPSGSAPAFVLLRDKQSRKVLIYVGRFEAYAISAALENIPFDRPMTHDLLKSVLERLGGRVERILIDDLWQDTYYAKICVSTNGNTVEIDSRPSDAIALALRTKAPIYMAESVIQQAAVDEDI
ncbi:MAG: bifunctional nuclease family protein, partial [Armatimonadetes bacterium]|nr:bifunctional nuclease family protein [Armatimonadota bacterium]